MNKKILLSAILFFQLLCGVAQEIMLGYYDGEIPKDDTQYIYADLTNIRKGPGIDYEVIDLLKLGEEVTVLKNNYEEASSYTQNGINAGWTYIQYQKEGIQKKGYVWSNNLTFNPMRLGNTKFIYGINALEKVKEVWTDREEYDVSKYKLELKILEDNNLVSKKEFWINKGESSFINGRVFDNLGLKKVKNIIRITMGGAACGIPTGYYYFAWNGEEILELPSCYSVSDAGVYYYMEEFIFPSEKGGKQDIIIKKITEEEGVNIIGTEFQELDQPRKITEEYLWNGKSYNKIN